MVIVCDDTTEQGWKQWLRLSVCVATVGERRCLCFATSWCLASVMGMWQHSGCELLRIPVHIPSFNFENYTVLLVIFFFFCLWAISLRYYKLAEFLLKSTMKWKMLLRQWERFVDLFVCTLGFLGWRSCWWVTSRVILNRWRIWRNFPVYLWWLIAKLIKWQQGLLENRRDAVQTGHGSSHL